MPDDYYLLRLGGLTSLITSVNVSLWGNRISVECVYNPTEVRLPYILVFQNCHDIRWSVHNSDKVNEKEADIIGFSIGTESHKKAAVITTDIFEISIAYGRFTLQKNW
ncbi:hypothetical protein I8752_27765 [Nostocaceae cyanobacterium CENA369]|uniref:Uncharacterized protein n=1 Tax=Dendronalium phyllosphericum CENA369 TaxID=1725256 RepID=A0A8J7I626_9NOST|nr:hypothetical protein [Dendronalium phyllosphericum]MBH8576720.1 hypothetical protein [Dendronalium phyllosphericum CENA369]